ncbi:MAG: aminoglycoside phosphotransferase family protein, partial [Candidatus Heimdallarchaeota archaeon]|nr:aminoglycoside phosphotransferase family protein [Candidatus Heimdallarchaeota archaeon]
MGKTGQLDLRDPRAIEGGILKYLQHKHRFKQLLSQNNKKKKSQLHGLKNFQITGFDGKYIELCFKLLLQQNSRIVSTDFYLLSIYIDISSVELMHQDLDHIKEIRSLNIYPLGKILVENNLKSIGYRFIIAEQVQNRNTFNDIRDPLGLSNARAVQARISRYMQQRKSFQKIGQKLMHKGEKFLSIMALQELALGLNNAVYSMSVEYNHKKAPQAGPTSREYILRVYPMNENQLKSQNEAKRYREVEKIDVPAPKLYLYEDSIDALGYRFLILEQVSGTSVLESINSFQGDQAKEFLADLAHDLGVLHSVRSKSYDSYYLNPKKTKKHTFASYLLMEVRNTIKNFQKMGLDEELDVDLGYLYKWFKGYRPLFQLTAFSLVHGDIRPSNIITNGSHIQGLIDWEMSCYSDP